jgi:hypothetical protein
VPSVDGYPILVLEATSVSPKHSSASADEVRSSYLDLVQVWHPDRFVNNPALQRKAEEKLKEINEAFTRLTSGRRGADPITTFRSETASAEPPSDRTSRNTQAPENVPKDEAHSRFAGALSWVLVVMVVFMAMLSLGVLRQSVNTTAVSPRTTYEPSLRDSREKADGPADTSLLNGNLLNRRKTSKRSVASKIDLDPEQQQSIESACAMAKYADGPAAYRRCVSQQLANLAASPPRPDLSSLDEEERQSIESACAPAKYVEGPAAYYRCLSKQVRLLEAR